MRGIDVFIARAEAHHLRPQPDGTAGHARTRSEAVATPEAATGPGGPEGVPKHPSLINGCGFADARQGLDRYPPLSRLRREYVPFRSDDRCVPAGPPTEAKVPTNKTESHP